MFELGQANWNDIKILGICPFVCVYVGKLISNKIRRCPNQKILGVLMSASPKLTRVRPLCNSPRTYLVKFVPGGGAAAVANFRFRKNAHSEPMEQDRT